MKYEFLLMILIAGLILYVFLSGWISETRDEEFLSELANEMKQDPELYKIESLKIYESFMVDKNKAIDSYRKKNMISLSCAESIVYSRINSLGHKIT